MFSIGFFVAVFCGNFFKKGAACADKKRVSGSFLPETLSITAVTAIFSDSAAGW
ncbi:hypothetical protein ACFO3A_02695 [Comamonas nitrativorans]|uniref:Uncharacterized protein n=1 Tax=Comamonas nitrativorans TaxID=108437 RepID=A0ABV9GVE7_9BURK